MRKEGVVGDLTCVIILLDSTCNLPHTHTHTRARARTHTHTRTVHTYTHCRTHTRTDGSSQHTVCVCVFSKEIQQFSRLTSLQNHPLQVVMSVQTRQLCSVPVIPAGVTLGQKSPTGRSHRLLDAAQQSFVLKSPK